MKTLNFDTFTKKIYIKAPMEKLYWCWATKEGICSWFLRSAQYASKDGDLGRSTRTLRLAINILGNGIIGTGRKKAKFYKRTEKTLSNFPSRQ